MKKSVLISLLLAAAVGLLYHRVGRFSFVSFDDFELIVNNALVRPGLTWPGIKWAFFSAWRENLFFYPLALLSHMLDCQLFGLDPAGHHWTSVIIHGAAVICFFLFLRRLTGRPWRSALAVGLFAIHPLGVDSVAWVAERSNVLCAALVALSLYAYAGYARAGRQSRYVLALTAFVLALLAKPTAVMMPVVLVLLDWLALDRYGGGLTGPKNSFRFKLLEKAPFFILAGLRAGMVLLAGKGASPVLETGTVTAKLLLANSLQAVVTYLRQIIYPFDLAVYYPFPSGIPWWHSLGAAALLILITAWAVRLRRRRPLVLLGWLWYLVFLIPSFGAVRSGPWPAHADHYVYISLPGIFIMMVWAVPGRWLRSRMVRPAAFATVLALLFYWGGAAFFQTLHFRDSQALFSRAVAVTSDNFLAHIGLGNAYREKENYAQAENHFRRALEIKSDSAGAQANLALVLARQGRIAAARSHFQTALELSPELIPARLGLANLYQKEGRPGPAIRHYRNVLILDPDNAAANYNLGRVLFGQGRLEEAAACFSRALAVRPHDDRIVRALTGVRACLENRSQQADGDNRLPAGAVHDDP
ncbi:MAG: tetratricopeptide repeat protein [Desulfosudaceae bacterium]